MPSAKTTNSDSRSQHSHSQDDEWTHPIRPTQSIGIVLYDPQQHEDQSTDQSSDYSPVVFPSKTGYTSSVPVLGTSLRSSGFYHQHHDIPRHDGSITAASNSFYGATSGTGAIRPGGAINILDRAYIGLLINFFIVGMVDAIPYGFAYPLFKVYLHLEGYKQQAATSMIVFGWTFKFIVGYVSDCIPIQGLRRKPYAMIGNVFLFLCLAGMSIAPSVDPYMKNGGIVNSNAPNQSWRYVFPCMLASFGHAILGTATQGMMVDLSHRESEYDRGTLACILHSIRFVGKVFCSLLIALGCNSSAFGGDFSFSLGVEATTGILAAISVVGMYVTHYHMTEQTSGTSCGRRGRQPFSMHMRAIYRIIERRVTWQFILFGFLQSFCLTYTVPAADTIYSDWLNGDTLTKNLFYSLQCGMCALGTYILGANDTVRNTSWRTLIIITTLMSTFFGLITIGITAFDVFRNKFFVLGMGQIYYFCDAFAPMIRTLVLIEIADPGYEATIYSLATSMMNVAIPLSTAASNVLSAMIVQTGDAEIKADTSKVRNGVMESYVIMYGFRCIVGIAILGMLPRQKREARRLVMVGSPNLFVPLVLSVFFVLIYMFVWTAMILSLFESTACLHIAGGKGCS